MSLSQEAYRRNSLKRKIFQKDRVPISTDHSYTPYEAVNTLQTLSNYKIYREAREQRSPSSVIASYSVQPPIQGISPRSTQIVFQTNFISKMTKLLDSNKNDNNVRSISRHSRKSYQSGLKKLSEKFESRDPSFSKLSSSSNRKISKDLWNDSRRENNILNRVSLSRENHKKFSDAIVNINDWGSERFPTSETKQIKRKGLLGQHAQSSNTCKQAKIIGLDPNNFNKFTPSKEHRSFS